MKPNILWICTDQQRTDTLGCYGSPFMDTPNIDRLAAEGVIFDNAHCQAPVCTPSRASFLTGRYAHTTKCCRNGQTIPATELLLPKLLNQNGYVCGLSGKLHLSACHPDFSSNGELRIDDGYGTFNWSHDPYDKWPTNEYQQWLESIKVHFEKTPHAETPKAFFGMPQEYHQTKWCVDRAIDYIGTATRLGRPWMFSVNIFDPHPPFDPPADLFLKYIGRINQLPMPDYIPGELANKPHIQLEKHCSPRYDYDNMTMRQHQLIRAAYYAQVENIDIQVGRLYDCLESIGILDNTIILFHSDHGEMLGNHGIYLKGPIFYDQLVHVPLIMTWRNHLNGGRHISGLTELMDLFPTLCDAVGIDISPGVQGHSMWSALEKGEDYDKGNAYCENCDLCSVMVRNHRFKLTRYLDTGEGELYNLQDDPHEIVNLYYDPAYTFEKATMLELLADRMMDAVDPLPPRLATY